MHSNSFTVQWHITDECEYNCSYCYLKLKGKFNVLRPQTIINEISKLKKRFKNININLTGGNPLLHREFVEITQLLSKENLAVRVLGNPIKENQIKILQDASKYIEFYQLSLDGTIIGHNKNRGVQNIKEVEESISLLKHLGIKPNIMFTLTKDNKDELIEVIKFCKEREVNSLTFSRLVPNLFIENSKILPVNEYKSFLNTTFNFLVNEDIDFFSFKDNLWKLFLFERGLYSPTSMTISGCSAGISSINIMPNGDIYPCSRIPIRLGNIQQSELIDIFLNNTLLKKIRDFNNYEKCKKCQLKGHCRGCPAIAYANSGDCLSSDPYCWKN